MAAEYVIRVDVPEELEERQAVTWIRRAIIGLETGGFGVKVERSGPPVGQTAPEPEPIEVPTLEDLGDEDDDIEDPDL